MTTPDLHLEILQMAKESLDCPEVDSRVFAEKKIGAIKTRDLREMAIGFLEREVDQFRRAAARVIEERSARVVIPENHKRNATISEYERWYADPSIVDWMRREEDYVLTTSVQRKAYIKWLGDRYPEWYERGCAQAEEWLNSLGSDEMLRHDGRQVGSSFASDFHRDGVRAYFAEKRIQATAELVDRTARQTRLEVTRELLDTFFALGDGSQVTWGRATVEQHAQRLDMLTKNASGIVETAARHQLAIEMIDRAGVQCLDDLSES